MKLIWNKKNQNSVVVIGAQTSISCPVSNTFSNAFQVCSSSAHTVSYLRTIIIDKVDISVYYKSDSNMIYYVL